MFRNHETRILVGFLLASLSLVIPGYWWLNNQGLINISKLLNLKGNNTSFKLPPTNSPNSNNQLEKPALVADKLTKVANIPRGTFRYGGSGAWINAWKEVDPVIKSIIPTFIIEYKTNNNQITNTASGIKMLLDNEIDFVQASRSISWNEQQQAQVKGYSLKSIPVAIDGIAIAVNPKLKVQRITVAQLRDIYTGKITNWSQLGGQDLPITPYSRGIEEGTVAIFDSNLNATSGLNSQVKIVKNTTIALQQIKDNLGGIYYASATEIVPQCTVKTLSIGKDENKFVSPYQEPFVPLNNCPITRNRINFVAFQNGDYPLTRQLSIIAKENGQIEQQVGEAYANLLLTNQGQQLLTKAGFASIY